MGYTKSFKKEEVKRRWQLIDLKGQTLGRVASQIAMILRGKNRPYFTPHDDTGDFVVAINAREINLTGRKLQDKKYYHYTGHIGGLKEYTAKELLHRSPEDLIRRAVKGMMPRNIVCRHQLKKLKIYPGPEHPHQAQSPQTMDQSAS